jgi:UDP-N-acetylmuramate: L-alanyl-gamma-D-glutamyl-meso-diaminopimelate ligase
MQADNPELLSAGTRAENLFYPEFLYEQSKSKTRGYRRISWKTTITMILHVMHYNDIAVDYMVGAQLDGFDTMVHYR